MSDRGTGEAQQWRGKPLEGGEGVPSALDRKARVKEEFEAGERGFLWRSIYGTGRLPRGFHFTRRWARFRLRAVLELLDSLGLRPGSAVLDVGVGSGMLLRELAERGYRAYGIDVSFQMAKSSAGTACARQGGKVLTMQADGEAIPLGMGTVEAVTAVGVLEYLEDPTAVVEEIYRVLKPGGSFIYTVHNYVNLTAIPIYLAGKISSRLYRLLGRQGRRGFGIGNLGAEDGDPVLASSQNAWKFTRRLESHGFLLERFLTHGYRLKGAIGIGGAIPLPIIKDLGNDLVGLLKRDPAAGPVSFFDGAPKGRRYPFWARWLRSEGIVENASGPRLAAVVLSMHVSGRSRTILSILQGLKGEGFRPFICCLDDLGPVADEARCSGIEVRLVGRRNGLDPFLIIRLSRLFRQEKVDIVQCHSPSSIFYGGIAARVAGVPLTVGVLHRSIRDEAPGTGLRNRLGLALMRKFVCVSAFVADEVHRELGIGPERLEVIYPGIGGAALREGGALNGAKARIGLSEESRVIGTVCRLSHEKGLNHLLTAFKEVSGAIEGCRLVIVGDGPSRQTIVDLAHSLGLGDKVLFLGARDDVPKVLPAFDLFVLASLGEGFGRATVEAMAAGVPVVVSRVGGLPEIVEDGKTGVLVPPGDPAAMARTMVSLFRDVGAMKKMGESGRARAREFFSVEGMVRRYLEMYRRLLNSADPKREGDVQRPGISRAGGDGGRISWSSSSL